MVSSKTGEILLQYTTAVIGFPILVILAYFAASLLLESIPLISQQLLIVGTALLGGLVLLAFRVVSGKASSIWKELILAILPVVLSPVVSGLIGVLLYAVGDNE